MVFLPLLALFQASRAANLCVVLDENFSDSVINPDIWTHDVTLAGGGNWEFEWYRNNRSNSFIKEQKLHLVPTFTYDTMGQSMINGGSVDLWPEGCTNNGWYGCMRSSNGVNIINPIQSAGLRTKQSVSINRGKVEVRARMPIGDWIWPAIWLLPKHNVYGSWPASGEIDIVETRGNGGGCLSNDCTPGRDFMGSTLHWGPDFANNKYQTTTATHKLAGKSLLSDEFHTFGLIWTNNTIQTYIDDEKNVVLDVKLGEFFKRGKFAPGINNPWPEDRPAAPFDAEFYLILNVAVGGTNGYFNPNDKNKPWSDKSQNAALDFWNAKETWIHTWPKDETRGMAIDFVKMWKEC